MIMEILSVRERPEEKEQVIRYFQKRWASESSMKVYEDCVEHCLKTDSPLPQWYLLKEEDKIVGGAGLITNDFISRMDLYPWICALFIEEEFRGHAYGSLLLQKGCDDAKAGGFNHVYLCTDHIGLYEKYGFEFIGKGYHPWGGESRIYKKSLE